MRLPRFTTRRLMVLVAVVALPLCGVRLWNRTIGFKQRAAEHAAFEADFQFVAEAAGGLAQSSPPAQPLELESPLPWVRYHAALRREYERAARYPWLLVAPDPPPPE